MHYVLGYEINIGFQLHAAFGLLKELYCICLFVVNNIRISVALVVVKSVGAGCETNMII